MINGILYMYVYLKDLKINWIKSVYKFFLDNVIF